MKEGDKIRTISQLYDEYKDSSKWINVSKEELESLSKSDIDFTYCKKCKKVNFNSIMKICQECWNKEVTNFIRG